MAWRRFTHAMTLSGVLLLGITGLGSAASSQVFWKNYGKPVAVEPTRVEIAFGTGFTWANHLSEWSGWGSERAVAEGVIHLNTCKPFCAAGNYKAYKGKIVLSKISGCNGQRRYRDVKVVPKGQPSSIWGSDCRGLQVVAP